MSLRTLASAAFLAAAFAAPLSGQTVRLILDETGDGEHSLFNPHFGAVAVDRFGDVYVSGQVSNNVFLVEPDGTVTEVLDETAGGVTDLFGPEQVLADDDGNVYVAGSLTDNVIKRAPDGTITEILTGSGDGVNGFAFPYYLALGPDGALYAAGFDTDNVFRVDVDGTITQVLDGTGDGVNIADGVSGVALDADGDLYVTCWYSDNVFQVEPDGTVTQIADATGDGVNPLDAPDMVAVDHSGNVWVTCNASENVFRIAPDGTVTEMMDVDGLGGGVTNSLPSGLAVGPSNEVLVLAQNSSNGFRFWPDGSIDRFLTPDGDGETPFASPLGLGVDGLGNAVIGNWGTNNVFASELGEPQAAGFRLGHRLVGELAPDLEAPGGQTFRFHAVAGTKLSFTAKGLGKKQDALMPTLEVIGPAGDLLGTSTDKKTSARIKNLIATDTGLHTLHVQALGDSSGAYRVSTRGRFPKVASQIVAVGAQGGNVTFEAVPGMEVAKVKVSALKAKGEFATVGGQPSDLRPDIAYASRGILHIDVDDAVSTAKNGKSATLKGLAVDGPGTHRLKLRGVDGSVGFAKVSARLRFQKGKGEVAAVDR